MKTSQNKSGQGLIDLRGRTFDTAEYEALRREMDYRVNVAYGHGFTLISVILVFFSAIFVFIAEILKMAMDPDSIFGISIWYDLGVVFAISVFCAVPVFIVYSFSVKYEDNLRQICNIAAYQKVFHECPSLIGKAGSDPAAGVRGWEMLHCNPDVPQAKVIASEYVAISAVAVVLSAILWLALSVCSCVMRPQYFGSGQLAGSVAAVCVFFLLFAALEAWLFLLLRKTRNNTKGDEIIGRYSPDYTKQYLRKACCLSLLTSEQAVQCYQMIRSMRGIAPIKNKFQKKGEEGYGKRRKAGIAEKVEAE